MSSFFPTRVFLFSACCVLIGRTTIAAPYLMTPLGSLGGTTTTAVGINNNNQIAGNSTNSSGTSYAYIWSGGVMTSIGSYNGNTTGARNINSSGQIEGNLSNGDIYVWTNGMYADYGMPLGGSSNKAYGFNDSGMITGQVKLANGVVHGFLYNPASGGSYTDIGTLSGNASDTSYGSSINASGQIEGDSTTSAGTTHAFIWTNGTFRDLGTFGGPSSSGVALNNAGHATGTAQDANGNSNLFFWNGTTLVNGGTLGGNFANSSAINNLDQIVGRSLLSDNVTYNAFLYSSGTMYNLNSLIPSGSGWTLTNATGINDSGYIVADGVNSSGVNEAFLLTPAPEPSAVAILAGGAAYFLLCRRQSVSV